MERKECSNGLQLIRVAVIKLRGHYSEAFIGALAMTTPLILALFFGSLMSILFLVSWPLITAVVLFSIFVAPLQMGYIKYFNNAIDGKQPRLREVYSYLKPSGLTLRAIFISGILIIMYIIGGALWMIPGGFAIAHFSMVLFFLQKFEHERLRAVMFECAQKMCGNRLAMFGYKLVFYFVYFMLFIVAGLMILLINSLVADSLLISWIVAVCSAIIFVFLYTFVTVYFHSSNQIFFEDVLTRHEKKHAKKVHHAESNNTTMVGDDAQVAQPTDVKSESKSEVVKEEVASDKVEVKEESPKAINKTGNVKSDTTKSTTAKKASTTKTTSTTTKKTTTTKSTKAKATTPRAKK